MNSINHSDVCSFVSSERTSLKAVLALLISLVGLTLNPPNSSYLLPFFKGSTYKLIQGWNGPWGHKDHLAFAYDFIMPIGSLVTASRDGVVIKFEEQYEDGNRVPGKENYIILAHEDGTFSRYYHLTRNGVIPQLNEKVQAGDVIAYSGNTGASAGPHLHFDVTKDCFNWGCNTIEFTFSNSSENPLKANTEYTAN